MATPETGTPAATKEAIVAAIKRYSNNSGTQTALPVMFKGNEGWRCIGAFNGVRIKSAKDAQAFVDGLLILSHLSAQKISLAEIDEGRFLACHG